MICDFSGAMRSVLAAACVEIGVARDPLLPAEKRCGL
jgi:hypothetical protein